MFDIRCNIFNGGNLLSILEKCSKLTEGATIFGYLVDDPKSFGVVEFVINSMFYQ